MREAQRHRALRAVLQIRDMERMMAEGALATAKDAEREARDARDRAEDRLAEASLAWEDHLGQGSFWPELAQALAGRVLEQQEESRAARQRAAAAAAQRSECENDWRERDMRQRQSERSLALSRRALLREREERVLEAVADRTCLAWSRR